MTQQEKAKKQALDYLKNVSKHLYENKNGELFYVKEIDGKFYKIINDKKTEINLMYFCKSYLKHSYLFPKWHTFKSIRWRTKKDLII